MTTQLNPRNTLLLFFLVLLLFQLRIHRAQAKCRPRYGCKLALASYCVGEEATNLSNISHLFGLQIPNILKYNPILQNPNILLPPQIRLRVPFACDCLNEDFLGHTFSYTMRHGDTYSRIAQRAFADLTTEYWLSRVNLLEPSDIPDGARINVTVNCSCGNRHVSKDYGLFLTYPLRPGEGLAEAAAKNGVPAELLGRYNPGSNFSAGLVFVPAKGLL